MSGVRRTRPPITVWVVCGSIQRCGRTHGQARRRSRRGTFAAGTAPAGHIRVPITLRQVVRHPRDDRSEERARGSGLALAASPVGRPSPRPGNAACRRPTCPLVRSRCSEEISRVEADLRADRRHVVWRRGGRRARLVRGSRGTTARPNPRSVESGSIVGRGRAETPSAGRSQSHGADTAEFPARPRHRECRAPVRTARQPRATELSRHCGRGYWLTGVEMTTPTPAGVPDSATGSPSRSESCWDLPRASDRVRGAPTYVQSLPPFEFDGPSSRGPGGPRNPTHHDDAERSTAKLFPVKEAYRRPEIRSLHQAVKREFNGTPGATPDAIRGTSDSVGSFLPNPTVFGIQSCTIERPGTRWKSRRFRVATA